MTDWKTLLKAAINADVENGEEPHRTFGILQLAQAEAREESAVENARLRSLVDRAERCGKGEYDKRACPWCGAEVRYFDVDVNGEAVATWQEKVSHKTTCAAFTTSGHVK